MPFMQCAVRIIAPSFLVFTALHRMQTRSSDENSLCLSVRPSVCHTLLAKTINTLQRGLSAIAEHLVLTTTDHRSHSTASLLVIQSSITITINRYACSCMALSGYCQAAAIYSYMKVFRVEIV